MGSMFLDPDVAMVTVGALMIISGGFVMMLAGLYAQEDVEIKRLLEITVAWGATLMFAGAYFEFATQVSRLESWTLCLLACASAIWAGLAARKLKIKH